MYRKISGRLLVPLFTLFLVGLAAFAAGGSVLGAEPDCTITAPEEVAAGSSGNTASVPEAGPGSRYAWSIVNGTITGATANTITWSAGADSPVTISVIVTKSDCSYCESSVQVTVNLLPDCTIKAPATVDSNSTSNTASVTHSGQASGYDWTIGNGVITGGNGTAEITWSAGSSSPVTIGVTVTDSHGYTCRDNVAVNVIPLPHADFTANPSSGCAPLTVQFNDISSGCLTAWDWNFGDGGTSSQRNPSHRYESPGVYIVSLTVTNSYGSDTETRPNFISAQNCASSTPPGNDQLQGPLGNTSSNEPGQMTVAQPSNVIATNAWAQPQTARAGQQVTIYANMANRGDIQGTYVATLRINGDVAETKEGSLEGNTAVPLQFSVSRSEPGTYYVDVNGQRSFFTVVESGNRGRFLILLIIIPLFAVVIALLILRRRKHGYRWG